MEPVFACALHGVSPMRFEMSLRVSTDDGLSDEGESEEERSPGFDNEDGLNTSFDREAFAHRLINNDKVEIHIPHFT